MRYLLLLALLGTPNFAADYFYNDDGAHSFQLQELSRGGRRIEGRYQVEFKYPAGSRDEQTGADLVDYTQLDFFLLDSDGSTWIPYTSQTLYTSNHHGLQLIFHSTQTEYSVRITTVYLNGDTHTTEPNEYNRLFIEYSHDHEVVTEPISNVWVLGRISNVNDFGTTVLVATETLGSDLVAVLKTATETLTEPLDIDDSRETQEYDLEAVFGSQAGVLTLITTTAFLDATVFLNGNGTTVQSAVNLDDYTDTATLLLPVASGFEYNGYWLNVTNEADEEQIFYVVGDGGEDIFFVPTGTSRLYHLSQGDEGSFGDTLNVLSGTSASNVVVYTEDGTPVITSVFSVTDGVITSFN